jgi:hypothetical protein
LFTANQNKKPTLILGAGLCFLTANLSHPGGLTTILNQVNFSSAFVSKVYWNEAVFAPVAEQMPPLAKLYCPNRENEHIYIYLHFLHGICKTQAVGI